MSRDEALELEPELNPNLLSAVKVPDGAIDPFTLVLENAKDAEEHGAKILLHTEITSLILDGDKVKGARVKDLLQGEEYTIEASYIINATGAWANQFLKLAGLHIGMALSKGSMLITNQRLNHQRHQSLPTSFRWRHHRPKPYGIHSGNHLHSSGRG